MLIFTKKSPDERVANTAAEHRALIDDIATASAEKLEGQLRELRSNEIHTEKIIHTETIKPVFSHICASDDYVRLLNENLDRAERTLSGQSERAVPGNATAPGRQHRN